MFFEKESAVAVKQMSLDNSYEVFLVSSQVDVLEDLDEKEEEFNEMGYVSASEVIESVKESMKSATLPDGFRLVGVWQKGKNTSKKYAVIDLKEIGYK